MICRKAAVMLPDANFFSFYAALPSSRAQNRGICALLAFGTPVFGHFEHKIGVFVRFLGLKPLFSGISSTKSGFLCAFSLRDPRFRAFRAQNRGFCALLGSGTLSFWHFEHKIGIFVRFLPSAPPVLGHFEHKIEVFVRFEISMIQDLDPRDNVIAERVNGILLD